MKNNIIIHRDKFEELWNEDIVRSVIHVTAGQILPLVPDDDIVMMCLASGGNWFFHNVLELLGDEPLHLEYAMLKSYGDDESQSKLREISFPKRGNIKGKTVILFDDMADTGTTIKYTQDKLIKMSAKDVKVCVLCQREGNDIETFNHPLQIPVGKWLVGCGMDHYHEGRNLKSLYAKV